MWDLWVIDLKSNMDRFIGLKLKQDFRAYKYLKSNMDRFIATALASAVACLKI